MEYRATVRVEGSFRSKYDEPPFFKAEETVYGETIGEVLDKMVEASYNVRKETSLWLRQNKETKFSLREGSWYFDCSWPSTSNPYSPKARVGAGGQIKTLNQIVQTAVHYRHLEIQVFFTGEIKYICNGRYARVVENIEPEKKIFDVFNEKLLANYRDYGYTGKQLDETIDSMGGNYVRFLKDYARHRSYIAKGLYDKIVIPRSKKMKFFWNLVDMIAGVQNVTVGRGSIVPPRENKR